MREAQGNPALGRFTNLSERNEMPILKPAGSRPSKIEEKLEGQPDEICTKQRPSRLALLHACMYFVGGVGRLLDFAAKVYVWWTNDS